MKFPVSLLAALLFLAINVRNADAHITLKVPLPSTLSGNGQKGPPPCGNVGARKPQEFRPGETIMVEWTETIGHRGRFRIAFDDDGKDFPNPMQQKDTNTTLPIFLDGLFPKTTDSPSNVTHRQMITFPNKPCDNCTLQVIQVMKVPPPYNSAANADVYYQCADIVLKGEPVGGSDGGTVDTGVDTAGSGGSSGSDAGIGSGGSSGSSGGSTGSGGSSIGTGGSSAGSGGTTGSGGTSGSNGGSGGSAPRGGSGGSSSQPSSGSSDSGGCSVGGANSTPAVWALLTMLIGLALRARKRR